MAFGTFLESQLTEAGVSNGYILRSPKRTALSVIATTASGQPHYSFYADDSSDRALRPENLPQALPADVNAIVAGSYALGVESIADAIEALLSRESGPRVISLDPNVRPRVVGNLTIYRERFERLLAYATIAKASDEDIALLYGTTDIAAIACGWLRRGPKLVVVTRGEKGATAFWSHGFVERPALRIEVIDTVGAGDIFHAGLLAWLDINELLEPRAIIRLDEGKIVAALDFAIAAAAIVCTRRGASAPSWDEVTRFIARTA